ncbi:MAG: hypothetical protein JO199_02570 [Candidatus Eremiobacteraeota bacterium]|nr:hypothetical protein [Candidatus Eremiobacteraeota bacterium]
MRVLRFLGVVALASLQLSACSSIARTTPSTPAYAQSVRSDAGRFTAAKLFVLNAQTLQIGIYKSPYSQPPQLFGPAQGVVSQPTSMALGKSGTVFIANCCAGTPASGVRIFAPPYTKPVRTITQNIVTPLSIAVNSKGWLFVDNEAGSEYTGNVLVFKPPYTGKPFTIDFKQSLPLNVLVGPNDDLFVANFGSSSRSQAGSVDVYKPPYTGKPAQIIRTSTIKGQVSGPGLMAIDQKGVLAVADANYSSFEVFAPPYRRETAKITSGISGRINALAISSTGSVAESDGTQRVSVFKPPYRGKPASPEGPSYNPHSLEFDGNDNLFAAESYGLAVDVFAAPYTGYPILKITNGVDGPFQLCFSQGDRGTCGATTPYR